MSHHNHHETEHHHSCTDPNCACHHEAEHQHSCTDPNCACHHEAEHQHSCTDPNCSCHHETEHHHSCTDPHCSCHHEAEHHHSCTDPNCTCHHEAEHQHSCTDPNCSCHHEETDPTSLAAQEILSQVTSFTVIEDYPPDWNPITAEEELKRAFTTLSACFSVNGMIMGHIKALLSTNSGSLLLSMTRVGEFDTIKKGQWPPNSGETCQLTVNAHSLFNAETLSLEEMKALFHIS